MRRDTFQVAGENSHQKIGANETDGETKQDQPQTMSGDKKEDIRRLRTKSNSNADFLSALADRVRHHSIQSQGSKEKGQSGKDSKERPEKSSLPERPHHDLIHAVNPVNRDVFIDGRNRSARDV